MLAHQFYLPLLSSQDFFETITPHSEMANNNINWLKYKMALRMYTSIKNHKNIQWPKGASILDAYS